MTWFLNMKIRMKLLFSFLVIVILTLASAAVGVVALTNSGKTYEHLIDFPSERRALFAESEFLLMRARRDFVYMGMLSGDEQRLNERLADANEAIKEFITGIELIRTNLVNDDVFDEAYKLIRYNSLDAMLAGIDDFNENGLQPMYRLMLTGSANDDEMHAAVEKGSAIASPISDLISEVLEDNIRVVQENKSLAIITERNMTILQLSITGAVVLLAIILALYVSGAISKPLIPLEAFMRKAGSTGDISLNAKDVETIGKYSVMKDETGMTIASAAGFVQRVTEVSKVLQEVAGGNLSVSIGLLSDDDVMGHAMTTMIENLNTMFSDILSASSQVSTGAKQVAEGAQSLAQGSTEQAASVQELSSSIAEIANKTKENANMASKAASLAETIKDNAVKGSKQMDEMISAVGEINDASQSINKVIKTIDDIAFQTNILALNAAVEAARAGQHGKGFAVVAEEVRNLAAKSAEAAKETGTLIENSIEKANLGVQIAGDTAASLTDIVTGINDSDILINDIARSSEEQSLGITQINIGIDQVAQVVQQNSATAEESAAASEEMSSQSSMLQGLISQFKLKDNPMIYQTLPMKAEYPLQRAAAPAYANVQANNDFGKY